MSLSESAKNNVDISVAFLLIGKTYTAVILLLLFKTHKLTIARLELDLVPKDPTRMPHPDLVLLVKVLQVLTLQTTSTEAHHLAIGVVAVLLQDPALVPTLETCRIPLLLAGSLLVKASQVALVAPTLPEVQVALRHGATTRSHRALEAPAVLVQTRLLKHLPINELHPALALRKMGSQLLLALALNVPRLALTADKRHLLQNPSHWHKVCDSPHTPQHHLSTRSHLLRRSSRLLLT